MSLGSPSGPLAHISFGPAVAGAAGHPGEGSGEIEMTSALGGAVGALPPGLPGFTPSVSVGDHTLPWTLSIKGKAIEHLHPAAAKGVSRVIGETIAANIPREKKDCVTTGKYPRPFTLDQVTGFQLILPKKAGDSPILKVFSDHKGKHQSVEIVMQEDADLLAMGAFHDSIADERALDDLYEPQDASDDEEHNQLDVVKEGIEGLRDVQADWAMRNSHLSLAQQHKQRRDDAEAGISNPQFEHNAYLTHPRKPFRKKDADTENARAPAMSRSEYRRILLYLAADHGVAEKMKLLGSSSAQKIHEQGIESAMQEGMIETAPPPRRPGGMPDLFS